MTAISPMEVERFSGANFRIELIEVINGFLRNDPGVTVAISEESLESLVGSHGELSIQDEMKSAASLYRAVGWRVIYRRSGHDGDLKGTWLFNAHSF